MQIRRLSSAEADFQKKFSELVAVDASVDPGDHASSRSDCR